MNKIFFLIIPFLFFSCNKKESFIDSKVIDLLSTNFSYPSKHGGVLLFVAGNNDILYKTNINILYTRYNDEHFKDYVNFRAFIEDALNQNLIFSDFYNYLDYNNSFEINELIKEDYTNNSLSKFIEKYCDKSTYGKCKYILKQNIEQEFIVSIQYYLFINNYKIIEDDVIGQSCITSW